MFETFFWESFCFWLKMMPPRTQVQQARVHALAAQFDKLAPDLRAPALAALHGRCKGSEKATLVRLYYQERAAAAEERGAVALEKERQNLALECIRTLWHGAEPADFETALSELLQEASAPSSDAQELPPPAPTRPSVTSMDAACSSSALALGVTIETQTPTGLPQLLLAEALSWHGQSPPGMHQPEVNSIGVGTAASAATTSESHTQTPFSSMPRATSLASPSSVEVGTSTASANELPASGWAWGGLDATTQTAQPREYLGESLGIQVIVGDLDELTAPSPKQVPLSARGGRTTDSGTSPLRFNDDAWG